MSKIKSIGIISGIIILIVSILTFLRVNNDHKECSTETTISKNKKGEEVRIEEHICKEKYNF